MVTEIANENSAYRSALRELTKVSGEPSWLRALRGRSFDQFERVGFPGVEQEEWKYTNVAPITRTKFTPVVNSNGTALSKRNGLAPFIYEETRDSAFVFVNGIFREDLSSCKGLSGVVALDLNDALQISEYETVIRESLERNANSDNNGFELLNIALFAGGLFISIPRGLNLRTPIQLQFVSEPVKAGAPAAVFPRVLIVGKKNSAATIIESYRATAEGIYLTNAIVDLVLDEGARVQHYKVQHTDTHSIIDHRQPHCTSRQLYKGILDGKSRAVFNGKVFVRHGAQQTDAQQTNKNLLLSSEAQIDTKPQLEIYADDVKCTHGAAVGQLDDDELFYLESRGINPSLAKNMLTYGFAEEVIERIKIDSIKRELDEAVLNRLHTSL